MRISDWSSDVCSSDLVGPEATEETMVADTEHLHRLGELALAVLAELVVLVGREVLQLGDQDLPHLAGGAGDQGDAASLGDIFRHRGALTDGLVVRVGVDEQETVPGMGRGIGRGIGLSGPGAKPRAGARSEERRGGKEW